MLDILRNTRNLVNVSMDDIPDLMPFHLSSWRTYSPKTTLISKVSLASFDLFHVTWWRSVVLGGKHRLGEKHRLPKVRTWPGMNWSRFCVETELKIRHRVLHWLISECQQQERILVWKNKSYVLTAVSGFHFKVLIKKKRVIINFVVAINWGGYLDPPGM